MRGPSSSQHTFTSLLVASSGAHHTPWEGLEGHGGQRYERSLLAVEKAGAAHAAGPLKSVLPQPEWGI